MFGWVISSDLPLNDPDTLIFLHHSTGSRSSPDISFAPSSLALSCSWEVLQDLGYDQLPILLYVPLSPVFYPNERPPSFNFQKARRDGFAFYFDSHHPSAEEYPSLSLYLSGTECGQIFHSFPPHLFLSQSISDGFDKPRPGSWTIFSTIDFSKVFDSVWHPALFHKLISAGLPPLFVCLFYPSSSSGWRYGMNSCRQPN